MACLGSVGFNTRSLCRNKFKLNQLSATARHHSTYIAEHFTLAAGLLTSCRRGPVSVRGNRAAVLRASTIRTRNAVVPHAASTDVPTQVYKAPTSKGKIRIAINGAYTRPAVPEMLYANARVTPRDIGLASVARAQNMFVHQLYSIIILTFVPMR